LVDPNNIQEIADAATRLLSDSVLAGQMREKGHKRAALFTVKRQGEETRQLYEKTTRIKAALRVDYCIRKLLICADAGKSAARAVVQRGWRFAIPCFRGLRIPEP